MLPGHSKRPIRAVSEGLPRNSNASKLATQRLPRRSQSRAPLQIAMPTSDFTPRGGGRLPSRWTITKATSAGVMPLIRLAWARFDRSYAGELLAGLGPQLVESSRSRSRRESAWRRAAAGGRPPFAAGRRSLRTSRRTALGRPTSGPTSASSGSRATTSAHVGFRPAEMLGERRAVDPGFVEQRPHPLESVRQLRFEAATSGRRRPSRARGPAA